MNGDRPKLLVVDDNAVDRERVSRMLGSDYGYVEAGTAAAALEQAGLDGIDCVLLDYRLPGVEGLGMLEDLVARDLPVVMLTGQGDERVAVEAMKRGACDYLAKSTLDGRGLRHSIANAMEKATLRRRVVEQQVELESRLHELESRRDELARKTEALRQRETKLRVILTQLPAIVWTTDIELRCASVAGSVKGVTIDGASAQRRPMTEVLGGHAADSELVRAHRAALEGTHGELAFELGGRSLEGRTEPLRDAQQEIAGVIGVALDVTETRQLEQQFRHAQKMEALGQLAGGVAHDFNNLLTAISSFGEFAREQLPADHPATSDVSEVLGAARRGAELVRKLLAFSRQRVEKPRATDVNELVRGLMPMLERLVGEDVEIELDLDDSLPWTFTEPGGVEQIIVNLSVNARDAMPDGGRLTISTRRARLDEELSLAGRVGLEPGEYVVLAVGDDGPGIPEAARERIFDPFFTTKELGKGSGLGLSTCYGIARKAGGGIGVYSELGSGTTFRVYLPAGRPSDRAPEPPPVPAGAAGGDETVLVVEDDRAVLRAVVRTLTRAGYQVLTASDAAAATALAERHGDDIRLVLSDVVMPGTNGPELVARLRAMLPLARIVFMSGYTDGSLRRRELVDLDAPVLEKPFTADGLRQVVRSALDRAAARDGVD